MKMEVFSLQDFLKDASKNDFLQDDEDPSMDLKEILNRGPEDVASMRRHLQRSSSEGSTTSNSEEVIPEDERLDGDEVLLTNVYDLFSLAPGPASPTLLNEEKRRQGFLFHRTVIQLYSITKPVVGMLFLVYLYVQFLLIPATKPNCNDIISPIYDPNSISSSTSSSYSKPLTSCSPSVPFVISRLLLYQQPPDDPSVNILAGSFLNAALIVGLAAFFTTLFVILFLFDYKKVLLALLRVVLAILLTGPWAYFLYQIVSVYNIPMELISYFLIVINFSLVGWYYIVIVSDEDESNAKKIFVVLLCLAMCWPFLEMPEWTVWSSLLSLAIYDLCAVLTPCGPLRLVINKGISDQDLNMPGLMYSGSYFRLGTGDFVFYGALVGRAVYVNFVTFFTASLGVIMGLVFTMVLTSRAHCTKNALPALPLSVLLGIIMYACTPVFLIPFAKSLTRCQLAI